jgi:hypothetical protein
MSPLLHLLLLFILLLLHEGLFFFSSLKTFRSLSLKCIDAKWNTELMQCKNYF